MTESPSAPQPDRPHEPPRSWRWLARGVVVLPIVVAVVRAVADGWFPVGDTALLAVRAGDVLTRDHPWLGSWTSASLALGIDVNNPGPLYYDLAAPFEWTLGRWFGTGVGTSIAVGAINIGAAVGVVTVGRRIDGWRSERWMLLLVAAVGWSMGSELLFDIWQPHALLLPFLLLSVMTVAVAAGDVWLLPWWIAIASLVVQTHVAYVYVTIVFGLTVLGSIGFRQWRDREAVSPMPARRWALTAIATLACWFQPIYEQLFGPGVGNLQRLATHASGGDLTVGSRTAVKIVAAIVALPPWWTRFGYEDSVASTPLTQTADGPRLFVEGLPNGVIAVLALVVVLAILSALIATLDDHRQGGARWAAIVSLAGVLVAIAGVSIQAVTVTGLGSHQIRWLFSLSLFVHVSIVWGVVEWWRQRRPADHGRVLDGAVAAVVLVLTVANLPFHAHDLGPVADRAAAVTLERTFDDLSDFDPDQPVIYDVDNVRVFEPYSSAVMMRLDELGVEFRFTDDGLVRQFGEHRRADGDEPVHIRQYEGSEALLFDDNDACVLSVRSGVDADAEREVDGWIDAAAADLASGGVAIDIDGLPDDVAALVDAAATGNVGAAFRVVADDILPVLNAEARLEPTPAIAAAVEHHGEIVQRVSSTLMVVATPRPACEAA